MPQQSERLRRARPALVVLSLAGLAAAAASGQTAAPAGGGPAAAVAVEGFEERAGKPAEDLSGIACRPAEADAFSCLVVNDESAAAQLATFRQGRLAAGALVPLIRAGEPGRDEAAGAMSAVGTCPGDAVAPFKEFDGEGVAWSPGPAGGGSFYIVGSHACGRSQPVRIRFSTHLLARVASPQPGVLAPPALTWRLGPALRAAEAVGAHYNQPLTREAQGLDIEGIAAVGEDLVFGLRAPSLAGHAFVVRASAAELFAAAPPADRPVRTTVARIALGDGVGIRDLAALPDGRLLVLSGPAQDQAVPFALHVVRPDAASVWTAQPLLDAIAPPARHPAAKAEGVAILGVEGGMVRLLVLFENPAAGGAQEYRLPLPR